MKRFRLTPPAHPVGNVLFGVSRPDTVPGVTRVALLMSHYYGAQPVAVHVALGNEPTWEGRVDLEGERLFEIARAEARSVGYSLRAYSEFAPDIAAGIRQAAEDLQPSVVILGESSASGSSSFARIAETVAAGSRWPLILTRFDACEDRGHVLAPIASRSEMDRIRPILDALEAVGCPTTVLESPSVESILAAATGSDLVVMSAGGDAPATEAASSFADEVARRAGLPILLVRGDLPRRRP